ncbi:MAG: AraC family transcriptional regulator [Ectothiorhodospiraceae bacterium]|nr:AraC family transcriptional regulator [Ectothiorhodospiraceae bacterium]
MDVLADVLAVTRFGNTTLCQAEFTAPWGIQFEKERRATFHIVSRGSCWLIPGKEAKPIQMMQGDVALVVHGEGHILADSPETPVQHYLTAVKKVCSVESAESNSTVLFCGAYHFEQDGAHPLLSLLPPVIYLSADQAQSDESLRSLVRMLMRERCQSSSGPGSSAIISRLSDVLFILVVRAWLAKQPECSAGWLGALRDPHIGKILSLVHATPQQSWSVASLANEVSMSRAAFSKRFSHLVGVAPLTYIRRWRMDLAARLLRESTTSVARVAEQVGYESETSFSKTFRQSRGHSPGSYRTHFGNQFREAV